MVKWATILLSNMSLPILSIYIALFILQGFGSGLISKRILKKSYSAQKRKKNWIRNRPSIIVGFGYDQNCIFEISIIYIVGSNLWKMCTLHWTPGISVPLRRNVRLSDITHVNTDKPISKHPPLLHESGLKTRIRTWNLLNQTFFHYLFTKGFS